jgi:hypothetical protein
MSHVVSGLTSNTTVELFIVFMSCPTDTIKRSDIAVIDLPGTFLHADCDDHVFLRFQEWLAEEMVLAAPQIYQKFITMDAKGKLVLFIKLQKALYGMQKTLTNLIAKVFTITINLNDPCVVGKDHPQEAYDHIISLKET